MSIISSYIKAKPCVIRDTRANLLALRNAGSLNPACSYVLTNPSASGTLNPVEILLIAVNNNTFANEVEILTSWDNLAWKGAYDIDTNAYSYVGDNRGNKVSGSTAISQFPFGISTVTNNTFSHTGTITYTGGTIDRSVVTTGAILTMSAGTLSLCNISNSTVTVTGGNALRIDVNMASQLNMSGGSCQDVTISETSVLTISGGLFRASTLTGHGNATIISGDNNRNHIKNQSYYTQVGTGWLCATTISDYSAVTSGNVNIYSCTITAYTSVNTTGSTGSLYYSTMNSASMTGLQNIPTLTISYCNINSQGVITATSATLVVLTNCLVASGGFIGVGASSSLTATGSSCISGGWVSIPAGGCTMTLLRTTCTSYGYITCSSGTTSNTLTDCVASNSGYFTLTGNTTNAQLSRCTSNDSRIEISNGNNAVVSDTDALTGSTILISNSVSAQIQKCTASNNSFLQLTNNASGSRLVNSSATGDSLIQVVGCTGTDATIGSCTVSSLSQLVLQNCTGTNPAIRYSSFSAYYYAYITLTGNGTLRYGLSGSGRLTNTITDPANGTPTDNF